MKALKKCIAFVLLITLFCIACGCGTAENKSATPSQSAEKSTATPQAIGPYSLAVRAGDFVFVSGQLGLNPETGELAVGVQEQTRQSLNNIATILETENLTLNDVVKTTVFLSDINDFSAMNEVYATFFSEGSYPARSAVEVARIPRDGLVEIEVIATIKK